MDGSALSIFAEAHDSGGESSASVEKGDAPARGRSTVHVCVSYTMGPWAEGNRGRMMGGGGVAESNCFAVSGDMINDAPLTKRAS